MPLPPRKAQPDHTCRTGLWPSIAAISEKMTGHLRTDCPFCISSTFLTFRDVRPVANCYVTVQIVLIVMKLLTQKRPARLSTGAFLAVLTLALSAPATAKGGCSHLVNSRADSWQFPSLNNPLMHDLSGQSENLPDSSPRPPCSGALCSGQPAAPAVPSVAVEGRLESWLWYPSTLRQIPFDFAFFTSETSAPHSVRRGCAVFHPPRQSSLFVVLHHR